MKLHIKKPGYDTLTLCGTILTPDKWAFKKSEFRESTKFMPEKRCKICQKVARLSS